jgi:hypothetical protein
MCDAIDYRRHIDPEYRRWGRKFPRFPGVAECVRLLRSGNVRGAWVDIIVHELTVHAADCLKEMLEAFRSEENERVRLLVLMAIAEARVPAALSFLEDVARDQDPNFITYAVEGLSALGTSEARAALWRARHAHANEGDATTQT